MDIKRQASTHFSKIRQTLRFVKLYWREVNMKLFKFWAKQFCLNTGLHGYKFIVLPKRILLERVFWAIVVLASFATAVVLLLLSKNSFEENPTTLVTDTIHHPIWNYPFPAVTLCSFNKISKKRALEQADMIPNKLNHTTSEIADLFATLSMLYFDNEVNNGDTHELQQLIEILNSNNVDLTNLLRAISPSCKDILIKCKWKEEERRCDTIFEKIITSEGHCCAFNYFAPKGHTFKGSYPAKAPKKPRHVSACGFQTSFEAIVETDADDYFATESLAFGIKVLIHSSYNYPDWSLQSYLVGMKLMALIGINPTLTHAMPDIRPINVQQRLCYFRDEFPLQNFEFYSYQNCLTECRMNIILKLCGCIPVVYVNEDGSNQQLPRICTVTDLECLQKNKALVKSSMPGVDSDMDNKQQFDYSWKTQSYPCKCLPDCEFVDYIFEASQGILDRKYSNNNQRNLYGALQLINHSVIRIYFNDLVGTRNRRNVSHSWQTYLAFYGGILGLFVGFSFISVIEFIYFFGFKLLTDALKKLKPNKNGMKESVKVTAAFENRFRPMQHSRNLEFIRQRDESPQWFLN